MATGVYDTLLLAGFCAKWLNRGFLMACFGVVFLLYCVPVGCFFKICGCCGSLG